MLNKASTFILALSISTICISVSGESEPNIVPSETTLDEMQRLQGGSPEEYRRAKEALKGYEVIEQYRSKREAKSASLVLNPSTLKVPFELEVTYGELSSITFLDINGNPWPIAMSRVGDVKLLEIGVGDAEPNAKSVENIRLAHIVSISTTKLAGRSNMKLFFEGIHKPINLRVVVKRDSYHDDVLITLPMVNPATSKDDERSASLDPRATIIDNPFSRALIDGVSVSQILNAEEMAVSMMTMDERKVGSEASRAIKVGEKIYLKVPLRSVNPTPMNVSKGLHGYNVYEFIDLPRIISGINKHGETVMVKVSPPKGKLSYRTLPIDDSENNL
jgi:hypothetical protein